MYYVPFDAFTFLNLRKLHRIVMESLGPSQRESLDPATLRRLANSIEVLGNIIYLVEMHLDNPEQIEHFIAIGKPSLEELYDFVRGEFGAVPSGKETERQ